MSFQATSRCPLLHFTLFVESQPPTVPQGALVSQSKSQTKKLDTLQKGDPRRLTLPLQRLKKIDVKPSSHKSTGSKSEGKKSVDGVKKKRPVDKNVKKNTGSASEGSGVAGESETEGGTAFRAEGQENSPVNSDGESVGENGQKDKTDQLGKVNVVTVILCFCCLLGISIFVIARCEKTSFYQTSWQTGT